MYWTTDFRTYFMQQVATTEPKQGITGGGPSRFLHVLRYVGNADTISLLKPVGVDRRRQTPRWDGNISLLVRPLFSLGCTYHGYIRCSRQCSNKGRTDEIAELLGKLHNSKIRFP